MLTRRDILSSVGPFFCLPQLFGKQDPMPCNFVTSNRKGVEFVKVGFSSEPANTEDVLSVLRYIEKNKSVPPHVPYHYGKPITTEFVPFRPFHVIRIDVYADVNYVQTLKDDIFRIKDHIATTEVKVVTNHPLRIELLKVPSDVNFRANDVYSVTNYAASHYSYGTIYFQMY